MGVSKPNMRCLMPKEPKAMGAASQWEEFQDRSKALLF
jgi:hypothetical protein